MRLGEVGEASELRIGVFPEPSRAILGNQCVSFASSHKPHIRRAFPLLLVGLKQVQQLIGGRRINSNHLLQPIWVGLSKRPSKRTPPIMTNQ